MTSTKPCLRWNTPKIAEWAFTIGAFGNAAVADVLGVSQREVRSILSGARITNPDHLATVAAKAELPLASLIEVSTYEPTARLTDEQKRAAALAGEPELFTDEGDFADVVQGQPQPIEPVSEVAVAVVAD